MKCAKCGVTFDASKKAQLGFRDFDCVEFTTDRHGREVVFDCPIDLDIENSVTLKEQE